MWFILKLSSSLLEFFPRRYWLLDSHNDYNMCWILYLRDFVYGTLNTYIVHREKNISEYCGFALGSFLEHEFILCSFFLKAEPIKAIHSCV